MFTDQPNHGVTQPVTATKLMLTVPEAAAVLSISRSVLYDLLLRGEIRSVKIGRSRRVPFVMLEEFVARRLAELQSA
jgi:excisionase family DNA binding protein